MKKVFGVLTLIELFYIISAYIIQSTIKPYIWTIFIFVIAPLASITFIIQLIVLIIKLIKRKKIRWNIACLIMTLIMAYPITILTGNSVLRYPTNDNKNKSIDIINPVKNSIVLGGKDYITHSVWPSEYYAYDILKKPYNIKSNKLIDYGIYLADIYSPVNGTIIDLKNTEENISPNIEEFQSLLGNYIFIEVKETKTYIILAHLEKNSINVSIGDYIKKGTYLGKVGNSGTTSEPHLHIQHQKNNPMKMKYLIFSEGLPMKILE